MLIWVVEILFSIRLRCVIGFRVGDSTAFVETVHIDAVQKEHKIKHFSHLYQIYTPLLCHVHSSRMAIKKYISVYIEHGFYNLI